MLTIDFSIKRCNNDEKNESWRHSMYRLLSLIFALFKRLNITRLIQSFGYCLTKCEVTHHSCIKERNCSLCSVSVILGQLVSYNYMHEIKLIMCLQLLKIYFCSINFGMVYKWSAHNKFKGIRHLPSLVLKRLAV